jgi:hypothetical protein
MTLLEIASLPVADSETTGPIEAIVRATSLPVADSETTGPIEAIVETVSLPVASSETSQKNPPSSAEENGNPENVDSPNKITPRQG